MSSPAPGRLREWNRRRLALRRTLAHHKSFTQATRRFAELHGRDHIAPLDTEAPAFAHSGHAGDLIYALPTARALARRGAFRLYLKTGAYANGLIDHPMGGVRLNEAMVGRLLPLLRAQAYIAEAAQHTSQPIDIELDSFRDAPVDTQRGNIARWYCAVFALSLDLSRPWLDVEPLPGLRDTIVIARSARYRNPALDYRFLNAMPRVAFVGIDSEFNEMRALLPKLEFLRTDDYLQLARIIRGAALFIGNQSSPYALAEALKVRRVLEVFSKLPNVIPEGLHGYEAWMQPQFERAVRRCLED